MATEPEGRPGHPGAPARLQLEDQQLYDEWCRGAVSVDLSDQVDRLAVDVELVMDMGLEGFDGPVWTQFANELAKYGVAVIRSWIGSGKIYGHCAEKGRPVKPLGRPFAEDEIEGLADETVAEALHHFRDRVLMKHKWDGQRGASLRTYFIGQCVLRFPNIYRAFRRDVVEHGHEPTDDLEPLTRLGDMRPGPERHVVPHVTAVEALASVKNPKVRRAMVMTAEGWPQSDIAEVLGVTEKAVERMLANERTRLERRGIA